jgi:hypothetical protein
MGSRWGVVIALVGAALNVAVVAANGGMPVRDLWTAHGIHIPMTRHTCWNWLADWIALGEFMVSPGDALIALGVLWLVAVYPYSTARRSRVGSTVRWGGPEDGRHKAHEATRTSTIAHGASQDHTPERRSQTNLV